MARPAITEEKKQDVRNLAAEGIARKEIVSKVGISLQSVGKILSPQNSSKSPTKKTKKVDPRLSEINGARELLKSLPDGFRQQFCKSLTE